MPRAHSRPRVLLYPPAFEDRHREALDTLDRNLSGIWSCRNAEEDALSLFFVLESKIFDQNTDIGSKQKFISWQSVAADALIVRNFNFQKLLTRIIAQSKQLESVKNLIVQEKLHEANTLFLRSFPDYELLRTSVAHRGEIYSTPQEYSKNTGVEDFVDEQGNVVIHMGDGGIFSAFINKRYVGTVRGRQVSMPVDNSVLDILDNILDKISEAYAPVTLMCRQFFKDRSD